MAHPPGELGIGRKCFGKELIKIAVFNHLFISKPIDNL